MTEKTAPPSLRMVKGSAVKPTTQRFPCTVGGWVWYCDEHDTHGNADSEEEAFFVASAHSNFHYWTSGAPADEDDYCQFVIAPAQHQEDAP